MRATDYLSSFNGDKIKIDLSDGTVWGNTKPRNTFVGDTELTREDLFDKTYLCDEEKIKKEDADETFLLLAMVKQRIEQKVCEAGLRRKMTDEEKSAQFMAILTEIKTAATVGYEASIKEKTVE